MNNWTKIGYIFLGLGTILSFFAIFEFINTFNRIIQNSQFYVTFYHNLILAALSVSFPIALLSALDYLVGSVGYYAGRQSSLRERLDILDVWVNDNFSVITKRLDKIMIVPGILGAIIAFLSIALPWWTYAEWGSSWRGVFDMKLTIYLYQATMTRHGVFSIANINIWYGWVALVLVLTGGALGIMGSLARGTHARNIVIAGGLFTILSVQVFMVGFQLELYNLPYTIGENEVPAAGWFWSGFAFPFADVTCYLSFGLWLALVAGIIMLVATARTNLETDAALLVTYASSVEVEKQKQEEKPKPEEVSPVQVEKLEIKEEKPKPDTTQSKPPTIQKTEEKIQRRRNLLVRSIIAIPVGLILWLVGIIISDVPTAEWIGPVLGISGLVVFVVGITGIVLFFALEFLDFLDRHRK